jgi:ATP-dependent Clp protease protease subunit
MSKLKDEVGNLHDNNICMSTRTIVFTGEINEDSYDMMMKNIHLLDSTTGTINIKLFSEGGEVIPGLGIYSAIKNCKNHVRIIVYGECSSMASIILQAADERVMDENSHLMIHVGSGQSADPNSHPRNKEAWDRFDQHLEKVCEDILLQKIKQKKKRFTRNQLKSRLQFDTILLPKDALELGLIDHIGEVQ